MQRVPLILLLLAGLALCSCTTSRTVTILQFSDYHSHAVPFRIGEDARAAGIARAIAWIEPQARRPDVLVFNGGDTMNHGAPAWSDKYHCVEWSWWNGVVDAMAWGNHDADYGPEEFSRCLATIDYPILSANVISAEGEPLFEVDGKRYLVFRREGLRIGVFAVAGSDFASIVGAERLPVPGARFTSRMNVARAVVDQLRNGEHVDAVVLIGHESTEDDVELARAVPGIDLILGTHSHRLEPLHRIEGTRTWTLSPGQYLGWVSRVRLEFRGNQLAAVTGGPVAMTPDLPLDPTIATRVASLEHELEHDPGYRELFVTIGTLPDTLSNEGLLEENSAVGSFVMDRVRRAAEADVAFSTSSSFRGPLGEGSVRETDLRDALPYDNAVLRCRLNGTQAEKVLERIGSLRGTDSFAQISGASLEDQTIGGKPIDPRNTYSFAVTDYVAKVTGSYRDLFEGISCADTGTRVREVVREAIANGLRP